MLKPVQWMGSSRADLKRFPDPVRDRIGFAIYRAQRGRRHRDAKPLKGFGAGTVEVVARHDGDTFRAVYTVRFETAVDVLHAFQKKAKRGIATPKPALDLIRRRADSGSARQARLIAGVRRWTG
ncbi:MAG: type II toxin-antitoxin system RelE/ParE family toxin [Thiotrichales bacterium]|nr:type II toxin-antitoxin system RelE/ParE family toxin [Thiotrichales bacterium]